MLRAATACLLVLSTAACDPNPKEGQACSADEAVCDGTTRMLLCSDGHWTAIGCGGPGGCRVSGRFVDCDESRAADGDPCGRDAQGNATCSHDGKHALECVDGRWKPDDACPAGCKLSRDGRWVDCEEEPSDLP